MGTTNQYQNKDAELFAAIGKLQQGDNTDVNKIYELSQRYIYKIINDIVKNHQTTEDLMQETYLKIYNKLDSLQNPQAFYVWAGRIATNQTLNYIQKNRHEVLATADENGSTDFVFECARDDSQDAFIPESILQDREAQRLLAEIIDGLSIDQKLSVQYFYYEEMSVREIAQAMNCSEGTVKSRLNYARKSIKDAVIDLDVNQGTRLYSLSALPLFLLVFREGVEKLTLAGTAVAGATAAGSAVGVGVGAGTGATATGGAAVAGATTAGSAAGAATATAGKSLVAKVLGTTFGKVLVAGVTTAVVAGGGIGIYQVVTADKPADTQTEAEDDRDIEEDYDSNDVQDTDADVDNNIEMEESTEEADEDEGFEQGEYGAILSTNCDVRYVYTIYTSLPDGAKSESHRIDMDAWNYDMFEGGRLRWGYVDVTASEVSSNDVTELAFREEEGYTETAEIQGMMSTFYEIIMRIPEEQAIYTLSDSGYQEQYGWACGEDFTGGFLGATYFPDNSNPMEFPLVQFEKDGYLYTYEITGMKGASWSQFILHEEAGYGEPHDKLYVNFKVNGTLYRTKK